MALKKRDEDSVFSLRLPAKDAERLAREARSRGTTISTMARQAIASGLTSMAGASLSYGAPSGGTLSISMVGVDLPETSTGGALVAESHLRK